MLPQKEWLEVIQRAPLVSIDLIIRDRNDRILLGYRRNEPARNCWFVPGGAIRKDERLDDAFIRIAKVELGLPASRTNARLLGVYEHFYPRNFAHAPGFGTHYVVLAYELRIPEFPGAYPLDQHQELQAFTIGDLIADPQVHDYTKAYFLP